MVYIEPYGICCLQVLPRIVGTKEERDKVVRENVDRYCYLIKTYRKSMTQPRLFLLPEFGIAGPPNPTILRDLPRDKSKPANYKMMAIKIPHEATDKLCQTAVEQDCYIVANLIEIVEDWPDWPFNTSILVDPKGKIILKYRKHCGPAFGYVPPIAIYSEYLKKYGEDSFFPVADTPLGKIGLIVCCDIWYPETIRCQVMKGAEVICHSHGATSGGAPEIRNAVARARAIENVAYVAQVNPGGYKNIWALNGGGGFSCVIDYTGKILTQVSGYGEAVCSATVDINALRKARVGPWGARIALMPTSLYVKEYQKHADEHWPLDSLEGKPLNSLNQWSVTGKKLLEKIYEKKILERPELGKKEKRELADIAEV